MQPEVRLKKDRMSDRRGGGCNLFILLWYTQSLERFNCLLPKTNSSGVFLLYFILVRLRYAKCWPLQKDRRDSCRDTAGTRLSKATPLPWRQLLPIGMQWHRQMTGFGDGNELEVNVKETGVGGLLLWREAVAASQVCQKTVFKIIYF